MRKRLIKIIIFSQTIIAMVLFFTVFILCWYKTGFYLTDIQLSEWGKSGFIAYLWNAVICGLGLSTFINSMLYLNKSNRIKTKCFSYFMFGLVSLALFSTGFFNLNWGVIHIFSAWIYFFIYPLAIFLHTHLNRKVIGYKDWRDGMIISLSMIVIPLLTINLFFGLAIPETIHIIFVIIWNLKIASK